MSASAWRSSNAGWISLPLGSGRSKTGDETLLDRRCTRGVWSTGKKSGNMDGERGNNEPGIVIGGGLRDGFSREAGEGGLRNTA